METEGPVVVPLEAVIAVMLTPEAAAARSSAALSLDPSSSLSLRFLDLVIGPCELLPSVVSTAAVPRYPRVVGEGSRLIGGTGVMETALLFGV